MKRLSLSLFLLFTLNLSSETVLLKGGLVHLGNGDIAKTQDILISDNIIIGVGTNLIIDGNTRVWIDLTNE